MKRIVSTAVSLIGLSVASQALAHDNCNINLDGNVEYHKGLLTVDMENGSVMTISQDHTLTINNQVQSLNAEQQRWVSQYYQHVDEAIPMSLSIAADGIALASTTINDVFSELFGADNDVTMEFDDLFTEMSEEMDRAFYDADGNIRISTRELEENEWLEGGWESQFEQRMESAISQSMGKILIALGTQMLWEGGDMAAFEEKMERFGDTIEQRVEAQALQLEDKAEQLCAVLAKAEEAENEMQRTIPGLEDLDMMDINYRPSKM
ncbi:DUF2884 family protein [Alteromonas sp. CYL-A6]|uniref:DUF2884 family protein n=1 Tax=Alteromonas nitratireducens TaxID=3390813 RepID=UPI0034B9B8B9